MAVAYLYVGSVERRLLLLDQLAHIFAQVIADALCVCVFMVRMWVCVQENMEVSMWEVR